MAGSHFLGCDVLRKDVVRALCLVQRIQGNHAVATTKHRPWWADTKGALAGRLCQIRIELFGENGLEELAASLGIPAPTWQTYESGTIVPAEVLLALVDLTGVEPDWLLHGRGPWFRSVPCRRSAFPN